MNSRLDEAVREVAGTDPTASGREIYRGAAAAAAHKRVKARVAFGSLLLMGTLLIVAGVAARGIGHDTSEVSIAQESDTSAPGDSPGLEAPEFQQLVLESGVLDRAAAEFGPRLTHFDLDDDVVTLYVAAPTETDRSWASAHSEHFAVAIEGVELDNLELAEQSAGIEAILAGRGITEFSVGRTLEPVPTIRVVLPPNTQRSGVEESIKSYADVPVEVTYDLDESPFRAGPSE